MKISLKLLPFVFFLVFLKLPFIAGSASFDCKKATTDIEKEICNDKFLSLLDETLGKLYQEVVKNSQASDFIKVDQREWLSYRNSCKESFAFYGKNITSCLKNAYLERIGLLGLLSSMSEYDLKKYQKILPKLSDLYKAFPKNTHMTSAETVSFKGKNYFIGLFVHIIPYGDYWSQSEVYDLIFFEENKRVLQKRLEYKRQGMSPPNHTLDGVECTDCDELVVRIRAQEIRSFENQYYLFDGAKLNEPDFEICNAGGSWAAGQNFYYCETDFKTRKITEYYGYNRVEGTFIKKNNAELQSLGVSQREIEEYERLVEFYRLKNFSGALELLSSFSKRSQSFLTHEIEIFSYWLNAWEEENKKN